MFGNEPSQSGSFAARPQDSLDSSAVARTSTRLQQFGALHAASEPMRGLFQQIERVAATSASVVILGESGSGKELVARALHDRSARANQPFVAINCGAIPETLVESELFGHERGSFTGAARTHIGLFERAHRGTLFLDEVTEMPIDMQVRLLRVLETGRFSRVGGDGEIETDVRVLAASNRELQQAVAAGRLREDLMYRLCVVPLEVPALRERGGDALLLARLFLQRLADEHGTNKRLSPEAERSILAYAWPGNVRELENVIHRAFVLGDETIDLDLDVPAKASTAMPSGAVAEVSKAATTAGVAAAPATDDFTVSIPVGMSLEQAERALISATLKSVSGSKSKAAQVLGISLKTLYNRLHTYADEGTSASVATRQAECDVVAA